VLKPNVVKGRSKSRESVIVLAIPTSAKGVRLKNERSKWLVQSNVPRPVLRPFLLSPAGAYPVSVEPKFSHGFWNFSRKSRYGLPIPFVEVVPVVVLDARTK